MNRWVEIRVPDYDGARALHILDEATWDGMDGIRLQENPPASGPEWAIFLRGYSPPWARSTLEAEGVNVLAVRGFNLEPKMDGPSRPWDVTR